MFTKDSVIVEVWVRAVQDGEKTLSDVPNLSNLREVVISIIEGGN